jgi:hypothetical protein
MTFLKNTVTGKTKKWDPEKSVESGWELMKRKRKMKKVIESITESIKASNEVKQDAKSNSGLS